MTRCCGAYSAIAAEKIGGFRGSGVQQDLHAIIEGMSATDLKPHRAFWFHTPKSLATTTRGSVTRSAPFHHELDFRRTLNPKTPFASWDWLFGSIPDGGAKNSHEQKSLSYEVERRCQAALEGPLPAIEIGSLRHEEFYERLFPAWYLFVLHEP
jgi:hypothetical protein